MFQASNEKLTGMWWNSIEKADELRSRADDWSLAGDAATATLLNKISQVSFLSSNLQLNSIAFRVKVPSIVMLHGFPPIITP